MSISSIMVNAIVDPEAYAGLDLPHAAFEQLRRQEGPQRIEADGFAPFWAVTRYDQIKSIETRGGEFIIGNNPFVLMSDTEVATRQRMADRGDKAADFRVLPMMDNPEHKKFRDMMRQWFTPQKVVSLESRIRPLARLYVDRMLKHEGTVDFAEATTLYPLHVIFEASGIPMLEPDAAAEMIAGLKSETTAVIGASGKAFFEFFEELVAQRRRNPGDDMISVLTEGRIDGEPIRSQELFGHFLTLMTAGHETSAATIASGGWQLTQHPELLERLRADPSLCVKFVEESVRWETPVKHFMRTAANDTEIGGVAIAQGDWMMLCYASGNRDEKQFTQPDVFNIDRRSSHLGFGFGAHNCIGQFVARLESRLFWEELVRRVSAIELAGDVVRNPSTLVCGPVSVPVRLKAA